MKPEFALNEYTRLSKLIPAIKGIAILIIVIFHLAVYIRGTLSISEIVEAFSGKGLKGWSEGCLYAFSLLGLGGVHLFLIASGFGLTASWWNQYQAPGKEKQQFAIIPFWQHRLRRIFPLYWLAHGVALLMAAINLDWITWKNLLTQGELSAIIAIIASLTTLRNFIIEYASFLNSAWWYIGLAVQLYLIFPLLIWVGKRWGWSMLLVGSLGIVVLYRITIISLHLSERATYVLLHGSIFPSRLFEFVFGMVLAIALLDHHPSLIKNSFGGFYLWSKKLLLEHRFFKLNLVLFLLGTAFDWAYSAGWILLKIPADAILGVGEFCLIFQFLSLVPSPKKWLNLVGNYSYGIYLIHINILRALWPALSKFILFFWLRFAIVVLLCCLLGGLFELGYNWLKQKLSRKYE